MCVKKFLENFRASESVKNSTANFLVTYFDFAYVLNVSPFRMVKAEHNNGYVLRKSIFHTFTFIVLNLLAVLSMIKYSIEMGSIGIGDNTKATDYFDLLGFFLTNAFQLMVLYKFCNYQSQFLEVVNFINAVEFDLLPPVHISKVSFLQFKQIFAQTFYNF